MQALSHCLTVRIFFITLFVFAFFVPFLVLAQESATTSASSTEEAPNANRGDFREVMQEKREQYENGRARIASSSDSMRAKILERRGQFSEGVKNRVKNLLSNIKNRALATIDRFERIITRIESRMVKLESEGMDVRSARVFVEVTKTEIASAKTILARTGDADVDVIVDDTSPREKFATLREKIRTIHTHIKNAHSALQSAVLALQGATVPVTENATSTPVQE